jgi:hypothetical protein
MAIKSAFKTLLLGAPGDRQRDVKRGLNNGRKFTIGTDTMSQRLLGMFEREIASEVAAMAKRAACALDIGANDGWYALFFASQPNMRSVYAFEPFQPLSDQMVANLRLNDPAYLQKTVIVRKFVGDKDDAEWCSVDATLPDPPRPLMFKIDVDGGEVDVLRGAKNALKGDCLLVIETHSPQLESDCIAFLENMGYTCRVIKNGWYRAFMPESRLFAHNRWLVAERAGK